LSFVLFLFLCSLGNEKTKPALPQRANSQPALDVEGRPLPTVDELSLVGYPDDVEVSQLFEKTGTYYLLLVIQHDRLHIYIISSLHSLAAKC